ncbi:MAG: hypothetical protein PWQ06_1329 [Anaerophaga sp.]|nr:hypothetical protein [Anaerophaga sp.]
MTNSNFFSPMLLSVFILPSRTISGKFHPNLGFKKAVIEYNGQKFYMKSNSHPWK